MRVAIRRILAYDVSDLTPNLRAPQTQTHVLVSRGDGMASEWMTGIRALGFGIATQSTTTIHQHFGRPPPFGPLNSSRWTTEHQHLIRISSPDPTDFPHALIRTFHHRRKALYLLLALWDSSPPPLERLQGFFSKTRLPIANDVNLTFRLSKNAENTIFCNKTGTKQIGRSGLAVDVIRWGNRSRSHCNLG
jgi:hypothetical protein